jgi:O-antigen ligase
VDNVSAASGDCPHVAPFKVDMGLPLLPLGLYVIAPVGVRLRISQSIDPMYCSNAERIEMLRVGFQMVLDHPFTGVGPGRVDRVYLSYLRPQDPIPAWYGHFHNNLAQIAAQFGLPVILAALVFLYFAQQGLNHDTPL